MKKRDLKKRIEDGFSELSPDLFEAVLEESRKQEVAWSEAEAEKSSGNGKFNMGRFPGYALSLCASMAIICLCIFGVLGTKERSVYMVLDINPSIQIEMNEAHQVKRLKGLNQDGKDVVKELRWKKKESVQELLDVLIQDVVEKSYLRENGGILVTLAARDKCICENLERTLGEGIDRKLTELKVSGVTTAFQEVQSSSEKQGRKRLEAELTKSCGFDEKQVQQMSVIELIQYCQDYTSLELKLSEASEKERAAAQKNEDKSQTPANPSLQDGSGQTPESDSSGKEESGENSGKDKEKPDELPNKPSKKGSGDGNQDSQEDNQDKEGNADNQELEKPSGPVSLDDSAQAEEAIPSDSEGVPIQPGEGKPIAPESSSEQAETGGSQSGSGSVLGRPESGGKSESEKESEQPEVVSPGQPGAVTPDQPEMELRNVPVQQEESDALEGQDSNFILDIPHDTE